MDKADLARAVANGAAGAQIKDAPPENLLAAIRSVVLSEAAYATELKPLLMEPPPPCQDNGHLPRHLPGLLVYGSAIWRTQST